MGMTLYERLGGLDAIRAVVDAFSARCAADDRINQKFARTDIDRLKKMLVDQVCEATGGPCTYAGRDMVRAHKAMRVTDGEFDALAENLIITLNQFEVPQQEQEELMGMLAPMRDEIVEVDSSETGTALPEEFEPAPPLASH